LPRIEAGQYFVVMGESYREAALRHWEDAELLCQNARIANADHLYGFSAECAIKADVFPLLNLQQKADLRIHINSLWSGARLHLRGRRGGTLFPVFNRYKSNPFLDWNINDRYKSDGHVSKIKMTAHRKATLEVLKAVGMILAGRK
jgi:hypothetical protein